MARGKCIIIVLVLIASVCGTLLVSYKHLLPGYKTQQGNSNDTSSLLNAGISIGTPPKIVNITTTSTPIPDLTEEYAYPKTTTRVKDQITMTRTKEPTTTVTPIPDLTEEYDYDYSTTRTNDPTTPTRTKDLTITTRTKDPASTQEPPKPYFYIPDQHVPDRAPEPPLFGQLYPQSQDGGRFYNPDIYQPQNDGYVRSQPPPNHNYYYPPYTYETDQIRNSPQYGYNPE